MGTEKELEPGHHEKGFTHVVQATDKMGSVVSRDPFRSKAEAEEHATKLKEQGHSVDVSTMDAPRTDGFHPLDSPSRG